MHIWKQPTCLQKKKKKSTNFILISFLIQLLEQNFRPTKQRDISVNVKEANTII